MVDILPIVIDFFTKRWTIETFIMFSLLMQTILNMFAPFRKRTGNVIVVGITWASYLLADCGANYALSLITNVYYYSSRSGDKAEILAFWAPFLLLHLGGPDSISAFALVDNALWLRHLVVLVTQIGAVVFILRQSLLGNELRIPTVFLLLVGSIRYGERKLALFLASLNQYRKSTRKAPDPGPNYAKLTEEYSWKREANLPTRIELIPEPNREFKTQRYAANEGMLLDDLAVVKHAYHFFEIFNGLIVDKAFSFRESDESRLFFRTRDPGDAFKVLAVELNFMYEVFYTKAMVVRSMFGLFLRFISWCAVATAFSFFHSLNKDDLQITVVRVTYTLLFGAIVLETIVLFQLAFSDWTAACIPKLSSDNILKAIWKAFIQTFFLPLLNYFLTLKKINWPADHTKSTSWLGWPRRILFRRWSESLCQYNLIVYCLKEHPKQNPTTCDYFCSILIKFTETLGLKEFYDGMRYVSKKPFTKKLWDFIFDQLEKKSKLLEDPDTAKRIFSARGDWVLEDNDWNMDNSKLMQYVVDVDYAESVIIWHIATELCYSTDRVNNNDVDSREFSKILSDYMLYLVIFKPTVMCFIDTTGELIFGDTCAEAKVFFTRKNPRQGRPEEEHKRACEMILEVNTDVKPVDLKGDKCTSVLFDASILAKELGKLEEQKRWKLMSEVWVELLSYAASQSDVITHASQLSKGGELITFLWLLMNHFGMGEQIRKKNVGRARAKLIVGK